MGCLCWSLSCHCCPACIPAWPVSSTARKRRTCWSLGDFSRCIMVSRHRLPFFSRMLSSARSLARSIGWHSPEPCSGGAGIGDGAQECILGLAGIEPRVLRHDGNIRADQAGKIRVPRDGLRILEVIEADMPRATRGHSYAIWTYRLTVLVVDGDLHMCILIRAVEHAHGFMA